MIRTTTDNRRVISGTTTLPFYPSKDNITAHVRYRSYVDNKKCYFFFKRAMDIVISGLFIVFVLSWVFLIVALLVLVDSKGPVFFVQRRVGRAGKTFGCYKFRTMIMNPEANTKRADPNDVRITRLGKILRLYNIDEFPQFVNVFVGSMSMVGPRPHMHADCHEFSKTIPGYKLRTFVKPGITGLAQANGLHGPVTEEELFEKRFQYDVFYVRNASVLLDVQIIQTTISRRIGLIFPGLKNS